MNEVIDNLKRVEKQLDLTEEGFIFLSYNNDNIRTFFNGDIDVLVNILLNAMEDSDKLKSVVFNAMEYLAHEEMNKNKQLN